jgi:ribosome-associated toxin RatA of RatAB toxin-antitoxin module
MIFRRRLVPVLLLAFAATSQVSAADAGFPVTAAQQAMLERREVVVDATIDAALGRGTVRAAIRIDAPAGRVFAAMTNCDVALQFVPHLRKCVVVERDPQGRFEVISHVSDVGWFMPTSRYTFRAEYDPPRSIEFRHVAGDFRENEGRWELMPVDSGRATIVTYRVRVVPTIPVPQWAVRGVLKRELPKLLQALRDHCEAAGP